MKQAVLTSLRSSGVVAVLRVENPENLVAVSRALSAGGVKFVEITMTTPRALETIADAVHQLRELEVYIGAGTVLDAETARVAILAGAKFIVSPGFDTETIRLCNLYGVVVLPGALTPQEVITAWKHGADAVKLFPADLGGPGYIKALKEPLPQIELVPTKGIDVNTAGGFLEAGAIAVGAGSALVNGSLIASKNYAAITENALRFSRVVREVRDAIS